jgi:tape measure domain-containing protein
MPAQIASGFNLATLGLRVDAKGAIRSLNQFSGSAHNAGKATEKFERTTKNLTATLGALGGYFGVRQLVEYADTWTLIGARVKVVTQSLEQQRVVQRRLVEIANRTRNTLAATSVLYTRTALNADQLGRSHEDLLTVVESVNAAMLVSGATGVEAAQAMRQFAQALGSGRVQGDEFRTMMEAMPVVARAVADEMGVPLGDLYKLSSDGLIDVNTVIDALLRKNEELVNLADQMPITVGQAYERLNNQMVQQIGILNEVFGVTEKFAKVLEWVGENLDKILAAFLAITIAGVAYKSTLFALAGAYQLIVLWANRAALQQAIITSAQSVRAFFQLARAIRSAADAQALLSMASGGAVKAAAAVVAALGGYAAYRLILKEIEKATEEWLNTQADLNGALGEAAVKIDEKYVSTQRRIEDMLRLAHQEVVLAATSEEQQKRLQIAYDAVNQRIEARRELTGDLLADMLAAIDQEEQLKLRALEITTVLEEQTKVFEERARIVKTFMRNVQTEFANVFVRMHKDGIATFADFFSTIKRMFIRLIAEMASAKLMSKLAGSFESVFQNMLGNFNQETQALAEMVKAKGLADPSRDPAMAGVLGLAGGVSLEDATAVAGVATDQVQAVTIEGITVTASKSLASKMAAFMGPVIGGFLVGGMLGGLTENRGLGAGLGAAGGAATGALLGSVVPGVGTALGALAGGLSGALAGFLGASKKRAEELKKLAELQKEHNMILAKNSLALQDLKDAYLGVPRRDLFIEAGRVFDKINAAFRNYTMGATFQGLNALDQALLDRLASATGITIRDKDGDIITKALKQLEEAVGLTIRALTSFGNSLDDLRARQDAYNALFDVKETPQQELQDTYAILSQLAPDLLAQVGVANLNLNTPEARETFLQGLRDIFKLIDSGAFTNDPALLGAFADKDQLIDAILRAKTALDEFNQVIFNVTTDFPRVMDLPFYEQLFGDFGTGLDPNKAQGSNAQASLVIQGNVIIETQDEPGEVILQKIEEAAYERRARGGSVDVDRRGDSLF